MRATIAAGAVVLLGACGGSPCASVAGESYYVTTDAGIFGGASTMLHHDGTLGSPWPVTQANPNPLTWKQDACSVTLWVTGSYTAPLPNPGLLCTLELDGGAIVRNPAEPTGYVWDLCSQPSTFTLDAGVCQETTQTCQ